MNKVLPPGIRLRPRSLLVLAGLLAIAAPTRAEEVDPADLIAAEAVAPAPRPRAAEQRLLPGLKGHLQFELARTVADPEHWSKARARADLSAQGTLGDGIKWKLGGRFDYDAAYTHSDFYPPEVKQNQRAGAALRENYLDISRGDWDFRLGKQHVVWGEMVGMFFADVVSARDLREFILPEFEALRIPQWAARAEYFRDDFHAEFLWIPVASYDQIGRPGGDFYTWQPVPVANSVYLREQHPKANADHMNYGIRLSALKNGWDMSGFVYSSMDNQATFIRTLVPGPQPFVFSPRHERINQVGGTIAKDFGSVVFKSEAVYTAGRRYGVPANFLDADGVVRQNTLDWAAGLDFTFEDETRFNVQIFQRTFFDHDPNIVPDKRENGYSLYLSRKFADRVEGQALFISSFNRPDWVFRPKLIWNFEKNWRLTFGADVFYGPQLGFFGQYDNKDRLYSEIRYAF